MRKPFELLLVLLAVSCVKPMYETDPETYKEHKYWETAKNDWYPKNGFDVLTAKTFNDGTWTVNLAPYREGMPSVRDGSLQAAREIGFELMTELCGPQNFTALPAQRGYPRFDRYFYRNNDMSLTVSFVCRGDKSPTHDTLETEQLKWSSAVRKWEKIDGKDAQIQTLPEMLNGTRQIKVRLFDGDENLNIRLARRIMRETCGRNGFDLLSDRSSFDMTPKGRPPAIIENDHIREYSFRCHKY